MQRAQIGVYIMNDEVKSAIIDAILLASPIIAGIIVCHVASWAWCMGVTFGG